MKEKKFMIVAIWTQWKYLRRRFHDKLVQVLHFHFILPSHSSAASTSPLHHQPSCSFQLLWKVISFIVWTNSKLLFLDNWPEDIQTYRLPQALRCHFLCYLTQSAPRDRVQRSNQPEECFNPGIHLQPGGDQGDPKAERSPWQNCIDRLIQNLVGKEQPRMERRRVDKSKYLITWFPSAFICICEILTLYWFIYVIVIVLCTKPGCREIPLETIQCLG